MTALAVWNDTIDHAGAMAGTLTCVAQAVDGPERFYALGAAHVLAPLTADDTVRGPLPGDNVVCRFSPDSAPQRIGTLAYWPDLQPRASGFANRMDVALVSIDRAMAVTIQQCLQQPTTMSLEVAGQTVRFNGLTTHDSAGIVTDGRSAPVVIYPLLGGGFTEVQLVDVVTTRMPADAGDSGALVVSDRGAVGMLTVAFDGGSGFCRLQSLFDALNLAWFVGPASSRPQLPNAAILPLTVFQPDPEAAIDTLARTLWGEARGEPIGGIRAVAAVVLNRAGHPTVRWWGTHVLDVCRKPMQFSCWNDNDPNRIKLIAVTQEDAHFRQCKQIADAASTHQLVADCALGATHYHTRSIMPKWARGKIPCAEIGNHLFYNNIDG